MDASETLTQLPLDFSATMLNNIKIKNEFIKHELNNNNHHNNNNNINNNTSVNMIFQQNNQQSSSAFKVVTPRKSDGKFLSFFFLFFSQRVTMSSDQFVYVEEKKVFTQWI